MSWRLVSENEFEQMIRRADLLEADRRGPKVYRTPDGKILKLFRRKRLLSSHLWSPFAKRFAKNARLLGDAGLVSIRVLEVAKVPHLDRQLVIYEELPGTALRRYLQELPQAETAEVFRRVGRYIDEVQLKGVFFRSFHFGNILALPDGGFGLIDVLDVWFKRSPLGFWRRKRNLRHLTRYQEDREAMFRNWDAFVEGYLERMRDESMADARRMEKILQDHRKLHER